VLTLNHRAPLCTGGWLESITMDERDAGGYSVTYRRSDIAFPVIVTGLLCVAAVVTAFVTGQAFWLVFAVLAAAATYYNYPLLETGRPTIGGNQYGVFVQGLGLIRWRSISRIDLKPVAARSMTLHHLQITLAQPLASALVADWRKRPMLRELMRLPWSMAAPDIVAVELDPLDQLPEDVHATLLRMWRYYRS